MKGAKLLNGGDFLGFKKFSVVIPTDLLAYERKPIQYGVTPLAPSKGDKPVQPLARLTIFS
jgi:hypothetical protein